MMRNAARLGRAAFLQVRENQRTGMAGIFCEGAE